MSDLALVIQAKTLNRQKAFGKLVEKYQSPVRRFFLSQTHGDSPLSDDLAQETFIKAYTRLEQFRATAAFSTWLYRIAYNVWLDHLKKQHGTVGLEKATTQTMQNGPQNTSLKLDLHQALATLTDQERLCISLQLIDGQPIDRICAITAMPEGTVKSHLSRGKKKLANYLKHNGYGTK